MSAPKRQVYQGWIVVAAEAGPLYDTARSLRRFAIKAYTESRGIPWAQASRTGQVRVVRFDLTTYEP